MAVFTKSHVYEKLMELGMKYLGLTKGAVTPLGSHPRAQLR